MDDLQKEIQNLAILYKIATSIFTIKDIDKLLDFSLEEAQRYSSSEIATLWFYDKETQSLSIRKQIGMKEGTEEEYRIKNPESSIWKSYSENKLVNILLNSESDKFSISFSKNYNIGSCIAIPFRIEGKNIGVFVFAKVEKVLYSIVEERMLTILTNNCAIFYENLLIRDNLRSKFDELEKINQYMVGRELKMIELKKEIEELKAKLANKDTI